MSTTATLTVPGKPMSARKIRAAVRAAVRTGNWMVRIDDNGTSTAPEAQQFRWSPIGCWTVAPDWDPSPRCGGGLHGVNHRASGFTQPGTTISFCATDPCQVVIGTNKIKTPRAMRLLVDELPPGLSFGGLNLSYCTGLTELPAGLSVGWLDLSYCTGLTELPAGLSVSGGLYLRGTSLEGKYTVRDGKVVKVP